MGDLTANFSRHEFQCPCGCGLDDINLDLVLFLQAVREAYEAPIRINSGLRCFVHNREVGGTKNSEHLYGDGVDIDCRNSTLRYLVISAAMNAGISRIGIANSFIHIGKSERDVHPQHVIWMY